MVQDLLSFLNSSHIKNYVGLIDSRLKDLANEQWPTISVAAAHAVNSGGKRLRPLLAILSCEAVCNDPRPAIPVAVAYELAHTAALIQDDVIDSSNTRRGKPALWTLFGVEGAILMADLLIFEVFGMLSEYEKIDLPHDRIFHLLKLIRDSARTTVRGEFLDLELTRRETVTEQAYLEMIRLKTGALLAAAAAAGAIVAGGSEEEVEAMYGFAERMGMAYQVQDDVLDIVQDIARSENREGKPLFIDLKNGKQNVVLVHALVTGNRGEKMFLKKLVKKRDVLREDIRKARMVFQRLGSMENAQNLSLHLADEGRKFLDVLRPSFAKDLLTTFSYVVTQTRV